MFFVAVSTLATGLAFGELRWLWALSLVPALLLLFVRAERTAAGKLARIVSPRLRSPLTDGLRPIRRRVRFALLAFALMLFVTAMARPQLGFDSLQVKRRGLDLIIAIDGEKVQDEQDLSQMMDNHRAGDTVKVTIYRNKKKMDVSVSLGEARQQV